MSTSTTATAFDTRTPRRRFTLKDRLAELDAKIARVAAVALRLRARREVLVIEARKKAQVELAALDEAT